MRTSRRAFVGSIAAAAAAVRSARRGMADPGGSEHPQAGQGAKDQARGGVHSLLAREHPHIFIDACMQIWPDADLANAHRHGVTAYAVTAWDPNADLDAALEGLMYWHLVARNHPNLVIARTAEDIRQAKRSGKSALILAAQDGDWVGLKPHRIEAFARLGLRMMLLAYSRTNQLAGGCLDRADGGLTRFGQLVVDECNRVGIVLDGSHMGKRSTLEMIERSRHPCVFSHSNPSAVVPNPRNIDDEQIRACAARGGVIGLVAWGPLVMRPESPRWPSVDEYIDLVDYVAQKLGSIENIGVSTDMSIGTYPDYARDPWGTPAYPVTSELYDRYVTADIRSPRRNLDGFCDYAEVVNLIDRLSVRGYKDGDIGKLLGGNFLRVFDRVWQ